MFRIFKFVVLTCFCFLLMSCYSVLSIDLVNFETGRTLKSDKAEIEVSMTKAQEITSSCDMYVEGEFENVYYLKNHFFHYNRSTNGMLKVSYNEKIDLSGVIYNGAEGKGMGIGMKYELYNHHNFAVSILPKIKYFNGTDVENESDVEPQGNSYHEERFFYGTSAYCLEINFPMSYQTSENTDILFGVQATDFYFKERREYEIDTNEFIEFNIKYEDNNSNYTNYFYPGISYGFRYKNLYLMGAQIYQRGEFEFYGGASYKVSFDFDNIFRK